MKLQIIAVFSPDHTFMKTRFNTDSLLPMFSFYFKGPKAWICWQIYWCHPLPGLWWSPAWPCTHVWDWRATGRPPQNWLEAGLRRSWEWYPTSRRWPLGVSSHLSSNRSSFISDFNDSCEASVTDTIFHSTLLCNVQGVRDMRSEHQDIVSGRGPAD